MPTDSIQSFFRSGVWSTHHGLYYRAAERALIDLRSRTEAHAESRDQRENEERKILAVSVQVFVCMSFEAFLNFYGIARLGDAFYKQNYERLGITEKLSALLATCENVLLPKNADVLKVARRLFDRRNELVHPKPKDLDPMTETELGRYLLGIPHTLTSAEECFEDVNRLYELMGSFDRNIAPHVAILKVLA